MEQSIYNDLSTALYDAVDTNVPLTSAQTALITAVGKFVQGQREAAAQQGQAAFEAWLQQQNGLVNTVEVLDVPMSYLNQASAGVALSSTQTTTVDGMLSYNSSGKTTTLPLGTYTGSSPANVSAYGAALNAIVQSASQPVTALQLNVLAYATTGPNLAAYLSAMMVAGNP
jgi:hypothetical protein